MNRRSFIRAGSLTMAGGVLFPSLLSCNKYWFLKNAEYDGKVLIVGAGAAGLYAGYLLKKAGVDFEILEASSVIGGRLKKNSTFTDFPIDLGAEWMHGSNSIVADLVRNSSHSVFEDTAEARYWHNGAIKNSLDHLDSAVENIENSESDISFLEYFNQKGASNSDYEVISFIAGEYGASPENISVKWTNYEERDWSSGDTDYKFNGTYYDLINDEITSKILDKIQTNVVVNSIDYSGDKVVITDISGGTYQGDKVIITTPISILKDGDISFNPALSSSKVQAFDKIGFEAGMKVFIKFSNQFYPGNIVGGSVCPAYENEAVNRNSNEHVMLGFVMGDKAKHLSDIGDSAAISEILTELDLIYDNQATPAYVDHLIQDWNSEPFVRGAYSYSTIGMGEEARSKAAEPVSDKLYFAGEAMNLNGHHQTVHGAMETGYREVVRILESNK